MDFANWTIAPLEVCLAVSNPSKDEEKNPTSHLSVHGFCILTIASLEVCLAVANPQQRRSRIQQRISPCMEHVKLDHPTSINAHTVVNAPEPATTLQHLNSPEACSPYQTPDATRCVQVHFEAAFFSPGSEDDVHPVSQARPPQHLSNLETCTSPYESCNTFTLIPRFSPRTEEDVIGKLVAPNPEVLRRRRIVDTITGRTSEPPHLYCSGRDHHHHRSPFHSSGADTEVKFQVRQLLVKDHSPIFLNSLQGGLHIPESLRLFLGAGSHWQTPQDVAKPPATSLATASLGPKSILSHESSSRYEALCIIGINVASPALLLYQEF